MELRELTAPVDKLLLDPNNYRFQDDPSFVYANPARLHEGSVQERTQARLRGQGLSELKNSIQTNGFLPFERIVVISYAEVEDAFVVVEGNRRVAALKWLAADHAAGVDLPEDLLKVLQAVPAVEIVDVEDDPALTLSLMGVRHVGGIREWGGFQRAKLVCELRDQFNLDTGEVAARLGMSAHEVNRRYRAYRALQQMMEHEEYGDLAEPDMYPVFHEAVAGSVIKEWLGWDDAAGRFTNEDALRDFYSLITPREREDGGSLPPKLPTRENVRQLREILPLPDARRSLLSPEATFADALAIAKADELSKGWATQVAEAVAALKSVGALELRHLTEEDLAQIAGLRQLTDDLLETHRLIAAPRS